jgi:hypothetical protein
VVIARSVLQADMVREAFETFQQTTYGDIQSTPAKKKRPRSTIPHEPIHMSLDDVE